MLITVFSDSHGNRENMRRALSDEAPDQIVFLGDGIRDAETVSREFPRLPFLILRGNCDWDAVDAEESALFDLAGVRIFAAHGHRHGVKTGLEGFATSVSCSGSRLGLYGHTHIPQIVTAQGITLMNPGSIGNHISPTYGTIQIQNGEFSCEIKELIR